MPLSLSPHAGQLTLLLVEDDPYLSEFAQTLLGLHFKRIAVAKDGIEGLCRFIECTPDIVLTDQVMPGLRGLDMVRKIRKVNPRTPVVLMTGNLDHTMLVDAINLEVAKFIPKPFGPDLLVQALDELVRRLLGEKLLEQHRLQEIELLRYRDSYHCMQQEAALRKEHHLVRHDLRHLSITSPEGIRWGVEVSHSARDIMCGDGYAVRHLPDGRVLIFLIDSMGSGLSASLTTLLATSFCNFIVEHLYQCCGMRFQKIIDLFLSYVAGVLLDDEAISCGFFLVDLDGTFMETAAFALPPLLVRDLSGAVRFERSTNPPLSRYSLHSKVSRLSLDGVADLLLVTDGVTDAPVTGNTSYKQHLREDFQASPTLASLSRRFHARIADDQERDDRTMLHLRRLDLPPAWSFSCTPPLSLNGLNAAAEEALALLKAEVPLQAKVIDELELVLTEALTNALEHGCLGLGREAKSLAIKEGDYDELLTARCAGAHGRIQLILTLWSAAEQPLLQVEVRDSGPGLPADFLRSPGPNAVSGRGLKVIEHYSDGFYTSGPGGCLIISKTLEGACHGT